MNNLLFLLSTYIDQCERNSILRSKYEYLYLLPFPFPYFVDSSISVLFPHPRTWHAAVWKLSAFRTQFLCRNRIYFNTLRTGMSSGLILQSWTWKSLRCTNIRYVLYLKRYGRCCRVLCCVLHLSQTTVSFFSNTAVLLRRLQLLTFRLSLLRRFCVLHLSCQADAETAPL